MDPPVCSWFFHRDYWQDFIGAIRRVFPIDSNEIDIPSPSVELGEIRTTPDIQAAPLSILPRRTLENGDEANGDAREIDEEYIQLRRRTNTVASRKYRDKKAAHYKEHGCSPSIMRLFIHVLVRRTS